MPYPPPGGPPTLRKVAVRMTSCSPSASGAPTATNRFGTRAAMWYAPLDNQAVDWGASGQPIRLSTKRSSSTRGNVGDGGRLVPTSGGAGGISSVATGSGDAAVGGGCSRGPAVGAADASTNAGGGAAFATAAGPGAVSGSAADVTATSTTPTTLIAIRTSLSHPAATVRWSPGFRASIGLSYRWRNVNTRSSTPRPLSTRKKATRGD